MLFRPWLGIYAGHYCMMDLSLLATTTYDKSLHRTLSKPSPLIFSDIPIFDYLLLRFDDLGSSISSCLSVRHHVHRHLQTNALDSMRLCMLYFLASTELLFSLPVIACFFFTPCL